MNRRNFGRVIKRIEKNPELHFQGNLPDNRFRDCRSAYCFIGHAEFVRTGGKSIEPVSGFICVPQDVREDDPLLTWLGLSAEEIYKIYWRHGATLADFKRWHKQGRVS